MHARSECLSRLCAQGVVNSVVVAMVLNALVAPAIIYALIFPLGFGVYGAALANGASNFVQTLMLLVVAVLHERRQLKKGMHTWHGW